MCAILPQEQATSETWGTLTRDAALDQPSPRLDGPATARYATLLHRGVAFRLANEDFTPHSPCQGMCGSLWARLLAPNNSNTLVARRKIQCSAAYLIGYDPTFIPGVGTYVRTWW